MTTTQHEHGAECGRQTSWMWILAAFAFMGGALLWQDHRAHMLGILPYLLLLACPVMHLLRRHRS